MGQKIIPTGFRLGLPHNGWRSDWFSDARIQPSTSTRTANVRDHITRKLSHAGLSSIHLKKDQTKLPWTSTRPVPAS